MGGILLVAGIIIGTIVCALATGCGPGGVPWLVSGLVLEDILSPDLAGPQGPVGPIGPIGPAGPQGEPGETIIIRVPVGSVPPPTQDNSPGNHYGWSNPHNPHSR